MKARQANARQSIALAAAVLLAGVSVASAAGMPPSAQTKTTTTMTKTTTMAAPARDTLALTAAQQKTAWKDLYTGVLNQKTPGFKASVGAVVPSKVTMAPVTRKAAADIPSLKPYKFAMVQKKLVIVNPNDRKIVDIIGG